MPFNLFRKKKQPEQETPAVPPQEEPKQEEATPIPGEIPQAEPIAPVQETRKEPEASVQEPTQETSAPSPEPIQELCHRQLSKNQHPQNHQAKPISKPCPYANYLTLKTSRPKSKTATS